MTSPTTLDELLDVVPGLRRCRSINADWLRTLLDRRKGECTWCGESVGKGRRKWCSDQCVESFRMRCDSAAQAAFVAKRDGDVCGVCGGLIAEMEREWLAALRRFRDDNPLARSWSQEKLLREKMKIPPNWREVDHIVPVVEGGGLMGPENLRLACGRCHKIETAKLRKRMKGNR